MRLPVGDTIVLPGTDDGALVVDNSEPPIPVDAAQLRVELLKLLPSAFRGGVLVDRDAVLAMLAQIANTQWASGSFALAATASPRFANGAGLDWWGVLFGRPRQPGEIDTDYRERLLSRPSVITPAAIEAAVNAVLAAFRPAQVAYLEPAIDAAYCTPASASDPVVANSNNDPSSTSYAGQGHAAVSSWCAFTQPVAGQSTANQTVFANTTKRLLSYYPDDLLDPSPPSYVVPNVLGAIGWIVTSGDLTNDSLTPHAQPVVDTFEMFNDDFEFVAPATTADAVVVNSNNDSAAPSYSGQAHGIVPSWAGYAARQGGNLGDLIIAEVQSRRGGGVAFVVMFDPYLGNAI